MKTKFVSTVHEVSHSFGQTICAGVVLLLAASASAQNLFVSDYGSTIYEFTPGGAQSTFATGMNYPFGLAFDSSGDLYVANSVNNLPGAGYITKITPSGSQSAFATGLDTVALAVNGSGDVYAAEYRSGNIYEYSPNGTRSTIATGFANPISLALDGSGNLFVGAGGDHLGSITKITPGGTQSLIDSGLSFPAGLAFNSAGNLFAASESSGVIYEYTLGGTRSTYATLSASYVNGITFDIAGNLYAAASGNRILEVASDGTQSTFATLPTGPVSGLAFQPVPEPSPLALTSLGGLVALVAAYRRKYA